MRLMYPIKDFRAATGLGLHTINALLRDGALQCIHVGNKRMILAEDAERWIQRAVEAERTRKPTLVGRPPATA